MCERGDKPPDLNKVEAQIRDPLCNTETAKDRTSFLFEFVKNYKINKNKGKQGN